MWRKVDFSSSNRAMLSTSRRPGFFGQEHQLREFHLPNPIDPFRIELWDTRLCVQPARRWVLFHLSFSLHFPSISTIVDSHVGCLGLDQHHRALLCTNYNEFFVRLQPGNGERQ